MPVYITPFAFILVRVIGGGALFWLAGMLRPKEKIRNSKDYRLLFLCSIFGVVVNQLSFFKGLALTSPVNAAIIMTSSPIIVLLAALLMGREKLTGVKTLGVLLGAIGTYLLVTKDGASFENQHFVGDLLILVNASSYALFLVLAKPLMAKYHPITVIKWVFFMGSFIVVPVALGEFLATDWQSFTQGAWGALVYVVIGTTFLNFLLNGWALRHVEASVVSVYVYLQPLLATLIAVLLFAAPLDWHVLIFGVLIMSGVFLTGRK